MDQRYSIEEKGKWIPKSKRTSPLRIPEGDNSSLIEDNSSLIEDNLLSIIGRVTNPNIQNPKAVIAYLPQLWSLESRVIGRDLGPETFQFSFETEEALNSVLRKGPYHFKKWMLIFQRWEPIVPPTFPSQITFWIKICGIPRHYSSNRAITTIGEDLGIIKGHDDDNDRVRVEINGMDPLAMQVDIRLPNGEITFVELEYEKLEKHCFSCFSLSHDEKDCPQSKEGVRDMSRLEINQRRVLKRMETDRRRLNERRHHEPPFSTSLRVSNAPKSYARRSPTRSSMSREHQRRWSDTRYVERGADQIRGGDRGHKDYSQKEGPYHRPLHVNQVTSSHSVTPRMTHFRGGGSYERDYRCSPVSRMAPMESSHSRSKESHTPPPNPQRDPISSGFSPTIQEDASTPRSRRPALERVSLSRTLARLRLGGGESEETCRLKEIEVQYEAGNNQQPLMGLTRNRVSLAHTEEISFQQYMPSSNTTTGDPRVPALLRITNPPTSDLPTVKVTIPRSLNVGGGRKNTKPAAKTSKKKITSSPLQGASSRKRNALRPRNPPKKKMGGPNDSGPSRRLPRDGEWVDTTLEVSRVNHETGEAPMDFQNPSKTPP